MAHGKMFTKGFVLALAFLSVLIHPVSASEQPEKENHAGAHEEEFVPGEFIIDHIKDSHDWHLATKKNGEHVNIPLPVIVYSREKGFHAFFSDKLAHGHEYEGFMLPVEGEFAGMIVEVDEAGNIMRNEEGEVIKPLDFSITRTVVGMLFSAILLMLLFVSMGRRYKDKKAVIPKGLSGFLEPMIMFIRDEIAIPNIGHKKYKKYLPYLLTVFFFILINNLLGLFPGLVPFGANVTGNIAVTLVLAVFTFVLTQLAGSKAYWKHIVATPGVPFWLAPIMIPVEIIGLFSKPFALMVRLFANITAGHIVVLSLVSLIFIFQSIYLAPVSIAFVVFMDCLEILVAVLQAYVFTLLSALFIGLAVQADYH